MQVKVPLHIIIEFASRKRLKELAFFLSLKRVYTSSHFHECKLRNFNKIYDKLGYKVSYSTYKKYLKLLYGLGLITTMTDKDMTLIAIDKMCKLFPCPETLPLRFIKLNNDENLVDSLERQVIQRCIKAQEFEIKIRDKEMNEPSHVYVLKNVNGEFRQYSCTPQYEVSLSCQGFAELLGYRSSSTGYKRKRKWVNADFIEYNHRRIYLGHESNKFTKEKMRQPIHYFKTSRGFVFQILADEVRIKKEESASETIENDEMWLKSLGHKDCYGNKRK